ncbi:MAG: IS21-like element helper ATPase IstB [Actinomycetota bacterium]|nr:IS21-like element helper ATPase IstB [Actinomycetota bacterium]
MNRPTALAAPAPGVDAELKALLRRVKLGRLLDTLPERLALARAESLPHADFLSLLLSDEVERRDRSSAELRARTAKLDPSMRLETFSSEAGAHFDRQTWHELCSLRLLDDARGALILGPVGVGKTHLATALGHIAVRRRRSVLFTRTDQLLRRLKAARLDNTVEAEMRKLARVELLILDDFALQAMDQIETADFYELVVERHGKTSTVITSNRDPSEWLAVMSDPLLAQSAVDRLVATSYELVIEGQSYRRQQRPRPAATGVS